MNDIYGKTDRGIHRVRLATLFPDDGGDPAESWSIETDDSRIAKSVRTFGSKAELDLVLAVEGRKVGRLNGSMAYPVDPQEGSDCRGGILQYDWFDIEEAGL